MRLLYQRALEQFEKSGGVEVFKRVIQTQSVTDHDYGHIMYGTLTDLNNKKRGVVFEINASNLEIIGPLVIKEIKDGAPHIIFRALPKDR